MKNFKRGDRFESKKSFDGGRRPRNEERPGRPSMHRAICSGCGKDCEVPFRPTGEKPVFCSNCFGKKDNSGNSRFEKRDSSRPNFMDKQMYSAVCDKCGRDCEVPFRPTGEKPVFCSNCFGKGERPSSGSYGAGPDQYRKQFEVLNSKLDFILKLLSQKSGTDIAHIEESPVIKSDKKAIKKEIKPKKSSVQKKTEKPKKTVKKATSKKKK